MIILWKILGTEDRGGDHFHYDHLYWITTTVLKFTGLNVGVMNDFEISETSWFLFGPVLLCHGSGTSYSFYHHLHFSMPTLLCIPQLYIHNPWIFSVCWLSETYRWDLHSHLFTLESQRGGAHVFSYEVVSHSYVI